MALSYPQNRTARRVPSKLRLSLGKLSVMGLRGFAAGAGRRNRSKQYALRPPLSMLAGGRVNAAGSGRHGIARDSTARS
jgi:hypothetical protein